MDQREPIRTTLVFVYQPEGEGRRVLSSDASWWPHFVVRCLWDACVQVGWNINNLIASSLEAFTCQHKGPRAAGNSTQHLSDKLRGQSRPALTHCAFDLLSTPLIKKWRFLKMAFAFSFVSLLHVQGWFAMVVNTLRRVARKQLLQEAAGKSCFESPSS